MSKTNKPHPLRLQYVSDLHLEFRKIGSGLLIIHWRWRATFCLSPAIPHISTCRIRSATRMHSTISGIGQAIIAQKEHLSNGFSPSAMIEVH